MQNITEATKKKMKESSPSKANSMNLSVSSIQLTEQLQIVNKTDFSEILRFLKYLHSKHQI